MMTRKQLINAIFIGSFATILSACTHNQFSAFDSPNADSQPKTPGYYNPNNQNYAMPQNQQPIVENQFYWKESHGKSAVAPE
ncbi:hypothetical protein [Cysteiniphilum sp. 6C5]|uniref:hypothetical protein n=1 Tax=unclassified Cysteiniphilum TaxID=2610889 RepID=UPI003F8727BB